MKEKLLILDMDNTILHSKIDFVLMQKDIATILEDNGLSNCVHPSLATSMLNFTKDEGFDEELAKVLWQRISQIEADGLAQAQLEPNVCESLAYLSQFANLAVLSNNSDQAIIDNLQRLGLAPYLSLMVGRDSVPYLKPSPSGMLYVKDHFPKISYNDTLAVGDAMIDAQAAKAAKIGFVAYNHSRKEQWDKWDIVPLLQLYKWDQQACDSIRRLWQ